MREAAISIGSSRTSGERWSAEASFGVGSFQVGATVDRVGRAWAGAERLFERVGFEVMLCSGSNGAARTDRFGRGPGGSSCFGHGAESVAVQE